MKKITNQLTGKNILFTGKMHLIKEIDRKKVFYRLLCDMADIGFKTSVSKKLDVVVKGAEPGPSKIKKIDELNAEGANIKIIDEEQFIIQYFELEDLPSYISFFY